MKMIQALLLACLACTAWGQNSVTPNLGTTNATPLPANSPQTYAQLVANSPAAKSQGLPAVTTDMGLAYSDGVKWIPVGPFADAAGGGNNGLFNYSAQNTAHLRAAVARVLAGTGTAKVALVGDSTTMGAYASGVIHAGNKPIAYPAQLAKILAAKGIPATNDSWFGTGNVTPATAAGYTAYNAAVTFPVAGFAPGSIPGLGAFAMASTTNGATLAFAPTIAFDTIDIYFLGGVPAGTFNVNVDGGASLQLVTPGGTHTVQVVTITGVALATHTINIVTASASPTFIAGMAVRASATKRVEVYNMGWSSVEVLNPGNASISYALPTDGTHQYVYFVALPVVAPDLTIINLTINDIDNQPSSVAVYQAALQTMVAQALVSGDCVLMVGNPGNKANWTTSPAVAASYQAAVYAVAIANGIPVIDLTQRWTSYAVTNPVMPYGDAGATALHPSQVGYADIARAVAGIFQ
jgi:lysophospholipase L1-like esterase